VSIQAGGVAESDRQMRLAEAGGSFEGHWGALPPLGGHVFRSPAHERAAPLHVARPGWVFARERGAKISRA
jgi:hypothetical protein